MHTAFQVRPQNFQPFLLILILIIPNILLGSCNQKLKGRPSFSKSVVLKPFHPSAPAYEIWHTLTGLLTLGGDSQEERGHHYSKHGVDYYSLMHFSDLLFKCLKYSYNLFPFGCLQPSFGSPGPLKLPDFRLISCPETALRF